MKSSSIAVVLLAALSFGGCLAYPVATCGSTTPISSKGHTVIGPASGWSTGFSLLHFFSFGPPDPLGRARDMALAATGGNALIDVRVEMNHFYILFLFSIHTTTLRGTAVLDDNAA